MLCFNRITVHDRPEIPAGRPVLYLGLHRNGALDGIPYAKVTPNAAFLVSAQLHRSTLGRFFFPGIPVSRQKDRQRGIATDNRESVSRCVDHLATGGELFIMPEGTSSLGPRHLPFKPGAARIAKAVLERGVALTVVPLAVHYECAWEWQSRVEVVLGAALQLRPEEMPTEESLHDRFSSALVEVGINVESEEKLRLIEMLAYGATLGTDLGYAECLKRFEHGIPPHVLADVASLQEAARRGVALMHQGVPLVPIRHTFAYLIVWLLMAPLMLLFAVGNLPVLLAGAWGSRVLPDDRNVVAFWRLAVALPATALWCPLMMVGLGYTWGPAAILAYVTVSLAGVRMAYRFRKLSVAVFNSLFTKRLRQPLLALHDKLTRSAS
jgi:hypothetical protein